MSTEEAILFDDCAKHRLSVLRRLLHDHGEPLVESFLRQTCQLLREEVLRQPKQIQDQIPPFSTITDFIERCHDRGYPILDNALLCIYQIGSILGNWEMHSWMSSELIKHRVLCFGAGLLAGTVVAISRDTTELSNLGPVIVLLAFRVGIHVYRTSRCFIPTPCKTLSGYEASSGGGLTHLKVDTIYGVEDETEILQGWNGGERFKSKQQRMVISTSTGTIHTGNNAYDLLAEVLLELLTKRHDLSALGSIIANECLASGLKLFTFGPQSVLGLESSSDILQQNPTMIQSPAHKSSEIAIVGFSGRFPSAKDADLLWELLKDGRDVYRKVPVSRFNVYTHFDPTSKRKNTMQTPYGCFVDDPGLFDARFFNVSPREAAQMDPVQRLTLITAYEALEMAGCVPGRTPATQNHRVGTFYGQASDDWREVNSSQDIDTYFIPSGIRAFTPGRINYHFKFSGPSYSIDTACSSSFAAIQLACTSLANRECDTAVTGGGNILTNPDIFTGLSRGFFLSNTGQCKTFDNEADGYCRADGVSSLVLKRLEDAEADNDNIFGVILGTKTNHSAEAVSITRPHHAAQAFLCRAVMEEAGVDPYDVQYVEMHGTGTQAGDYHEILSVSEVFAPKSSTPRTTPLYVGAVKANIGHGEAAAGVMSLVKVIKMLQNNAIPPHVGIKSGVMNQRFPDDLKARNLHIPLTLTPWPPNKDGSHRLVFLNNFSAAGGNTAILLREGPLKPPTSKHDPRSALVISVSAKSARSLKDNMRNLAAYIVANPSTSLADLSYTTGARRIGHSYRFAFSAQEIARVPEILQSASKQAFFPPQPAKVAFVFTGQGAAYCSLGRELFETSSQFRSHILLCEKLARSQGLPTFKPLIDGSESDFSSLSLVVLQLGAVCVQMVLADLLIAFGIQPSLVIGHSIGEYAALYAAGALSANEVIYVVGNRARLLEEHCRVGSHGMLAVKAPEASLAPYLTGTNVSISCSNGPEDIVLGGIQGAIDGLMQRISTDGIKYTKLAVTHAFHSSQMDPILDELKNIADSTIFATPKIPIISSLLGRVMEPDTLGPEYLVRHTRERVNFCAGVLDANRNQVIDEQTIWVEIGSHPICIGMLKSILGPGVVGLPSLKKKEDPWSTLSSTLAYLFNRGLPVNWSEYHRDFDEAHKLLTLPPYAFDLKNYWIPYLNDWCLTKGESTAISTANQPPPAPSLPKKSFTLTVQEILQESVEGTSRTLLVQTDLSHPKLRRLIMGHLVNGIGLCPSAVYAEMALTIASYLHKRNNMDLEAEGMDVCSMAVNKPLILNTDEGKPQLIRVAAALKDSVVEFRFYSEDLNGKTVDHAKCRVKYGNPQKWLDKWNRKSYMVHNQIKRLESCVGKVTIHRLGRGMVYKLFAALVDYDNSFRGMDEVILDTPDFEAVAKVTFKSTESEEEDYFMNPRWIDNLCHITGFIVNASEATQSEEQVYISHGWESMRFAKAFSRGITYRTYSRMQLVGKGDVRQGDVYILDGDNIVGLAGGVKFQCVPRKLLDHLLPPVGKVSKMSGIQPVANSALSKSDAKRLSHQTRPSQKNPTMESSTPKSAKAMISETKHSHNIIAVLEIIATECGVDQDELNDNSIFDELGVDSLLALTILARLREELGTEIESSFFKENPTVGDLKRFFGSLNIESPEPLNKLDGLDERSTLSSSRPSPGSSVVHTSSEYESDSSVPDDGDHSVIVRTIIANEIGVDLEEITDNADLAAMGLDSLMILSITAGIREKTELTVPDNVLSRCTVILELEKALGIHKMPPKQDHPVGIKAVPSGPNARPQALSFLIQGNPRTARETLFFFPDGSGSATSYAPLPPIRKDVCVYSLNCPFMKIPQEFNCGIDGVCSIYLEEVMRRQQTGPYNLGGWSAGGVMAYEAALQLQARGETVTRLVLIDAPCPVKLEPVPSKLFGFFDSIGVLGDRNHTKNSKPSPSYLIPHFEAMIRNLDTYVAKPLLKPMELKVLAIWARDGVCKNPRDPRPKREPTDPKVMDWLLDNRVDFGPNGWDQLTGKGNFKSVSMEGHHFSMIVDPRVKHLGSLISENF